MRLNPNSKSRVGLCVAKEIQRFVPINSGRRRTYYPVWENLILIKARGVIEAFERISKYHKQSQSTDIEEYGGIKGRWVFDGIVDLVPIYEGFGDFSEIMWTERPRVSLKSIKKCLLTKAKVLSHYKERRQRRITRRCSRRSGLSRSVRSTARAIPSRG